MGQTEIVIKDACILFDLIDLDLMEAFYTLPVSVLTTPQVINEIEEESQLEIVNRFVDTNELIVDGDGDLDEIENILSTNKGLSFADSSVLELAIRKNGCVLSSDGQLRIVTTKNDLAVRGLLWVIRELVNNFILTRPEAIAKLKQYPEINSRAPKAEIKELIATLEFEITNPPQNQ